MKMKKLLYVGYYIDQELFMDMVREGNTELSQARQNFELRLLNEFNKKLPTEQWEVVSYVPERKEKKAITTAKIGEKQVKVFSISRTNMLSQIRALREFYKYLKSNNFYDYNVLMYSVHPILSIPIFMLRKRFRFTVSTICSEIPQFRAAGNKISVFSKIKLYLQKLENRMFDRYILFADAMKDVIPVGKKPYTVIEGIAPDYNCETLTSKRNIVMYAGGLGAQNNIELLMDACNATEAVEELWICGSGGNVDDIKARSKGKIKYLGNLSPEEIMPLEQKAKLLVNLRNPDLEITRFAFPSKILEYMSSGTAVLSTNLEGIPKEYHSYISVLEDLSIVSVKAAIEKILMTDEKEYSELCEKARKFVLEKKCAVFQAAQILDFCTKH